MFYFIRLLSAFAIFSLIIGLSHTSFANSTPKIDENGRLILPNPIQLSKLPTDSKQFFENNNAYEYGARLYIQEVGEQDRTQGYTLYSQRAYNEIESVLGHTPRWESWADKIKAHAESDGSIQIVGHLTTNGIQKKGDYLGSATFRTISKNSRDSTKNHAFSEILPEIRARNYFVDQMERAGNDVLPQDRAKLIENYLYQSTQAKPNEHRAPYIFNPHYRQYVTDGEYYGREADYVRCGRYTYYGLNGSKICRSAPMGIWERTKQDVSGTYQSASEHLDNVWQDTNDKARRDKERITAGVDAPDDLNFFGWASHHANGLFDAATTIPDAIIRTTRADEALGYAYDKSVPDGVKETISNLKEAHNNWKQNNPNTAEVGEFGVNVGAAAVGARAKPPKGVGGGSDGLGGASLGVPPIDERLVSGNKPLKTSKNDNQEHNSQSSQTGLVNYDPHEAVKQSLKGGRVDLDVLKAMIPNDTPNTFTPSMTISTGYKYSFDINGTKVEIKWHSPDINAAQKYPNSNSGREWTAQIKVGNKLLGSDGKFYRKPSNITHIPLQ